MTIGRLVQFSLCDVNEALRDCSTLVALVIYVTDTNLYMQF